MADSILQELEAEYARLRQQNQQEEQRRQAEVIARCPEAAEVLSGRQALVYGATRGILAGETDASSLPERMQALNDRLQAQLQAGGFPGDYLEPVYRCARCRDTGYEGEPVKRMCTCLRQAYFRRLYESAGPEASFEAFDLSVFDGTERLPGVDLTQRQLMTLLRNECEKYADRYPRAEVRELVFTGKSGLGKTYLMHCVARRLLERGISAVMVTSYRYLEAARQAVFAGDSEALDRCMGAEVLLLDDLGSEPMLNNVTVEQIFTLVNERERTGRGLVVSTNLNEAELRARYTERVTSRLLSADSCRVLNFLGRDLRRPKGGGGL